MYDSTAARDIPANAQLVAGYVDGLYRWSEAAWARFPTATKVRIAVFAATDDGQVGDVESGDMTPISAVSWVQMRRRAGVDPTLYVNESNKAATEAAFAAAGVAQPHYWLALYDGIQDLPPGCVAKQFINPPGSGGNYDLSAVADYWPGVDSAQGGAKDPMYLIFELKPGERKAVGSLTDKTYWNATYAPDDAVAGLATYCYDYANPGAPLGSVTQQLEGNKPNVAGPVEQTGQMASLGAHGPCVAMFINTTTPDYAGYDAEAPITVVLHD
jgi:hypothetical protein